MTRNEITDKSVAPSFVVICFLFCFYSTSAIIEYVMVYMRHSIDVSGVMTLAPSFHHRR
jgi:hypothetical protein